MNDLFGDELARWKPIEKAFFDVFSDFGFAEIRTPTLEHLEVFVHTVGDTSDIVEKQMYTVKDQSEEVLVLRPEGTASFMRAIIQHQLFQLAGPQRFFYYLPMFRHERPQKGRLRQFHQFGAELIQDASPEADAELITLMDTLLRRVDLQQFRTRINSVGCAHCRPPYRTALTDYLNDHGKQLCDTCKQRMERAPLRVFDCKNETCRRITESAPKMLEHLCGDCKSHHDNLKTRLTQLKTPFEEDPLIVRGLDYYCRTAFETTSPDLGAQDALGGGGRYDNLSVQFARPSIPGVGFAIGMERVILALQTSGTSIASTSGPLVYLAALGKRAFDLLFPLSFELKRNQIRSEISHGFDKSLKNHLKRADRLGCAYTIVVGDNELANSTAIIKDMKSGMQDNVSFEDLAQLIKRKATRVPQT